MKRERILKVVPTLIIGLGGTGALGVQYAKRKIQKGLRDRAYKDEALKKVPFIEHLVLDTTSQEEFIEELSGDQYINMGHKNLSRVINAMGYDPKYDVLGWFPKHIDPGQIDSGARGVRAIGRLCLFLSKPDVERSLRDKIRSITDYGEVDRSLKENFEGISLEPGSSIDVHIITSLCGGTGSACLLDVAYLIKDIIADVTKQGTNSIAHMVTTEPFGSETGIGRTTREYLDYNFAISIAEIEHFNRVGSWNVTYLDKSKVSSNEKPFSIAYLLGNKEGESLSKKHICEIVGETIAMTSVSQEGKLVKGLLDNMRSHVINTLDVIGNLKTYSSYNTRILTAELDAQTIEASNVFAAQRIVDLMVQGNIMVEDIDTLADHLTNRIGVARLTIRGIGFQGFKEFIDRGLKITGTPFDAIQRDLRNWAVMRRLKSGKTLEDWMGQYDLVMKSRTELRSDIEKNISVNFLRFRELIDDEIRWLLLDEAKSLLESENVLLRIESDLTKALSEIKTYVDSLTDQGMEYEKPMRAAITAGESQRFGELAVKRLHKDVSLPVFEHLDKCYRELMAFVIDRRNCCSQAINFFKQTRELLQEERVREFSYTVHSIWTKEVVADRINIAKKLLAKSFLLKVEDEFLRMRKNGEQARGGSAFLSYLMEITRERKSLIAQLLRMSAREIIEKEILSSTINFNRDEHGMENPALRTDKIHEFVEAASPVWQIDRGGEDMPTVSVTNCPQYSVLGQIIIDLGKNINFFEDSNNPRDLLVFRSEHGASARRLLNLDMAMVAVRRRMIREDKHDINDLCLDPDWKIENPIPIERTDPISLFSLGIMFRFIRQRIDVFFFSNEKGQEVLLSKSINPNKRCLRHEAYQGFLRLESKDDEEWNYLRSRIIAERKKYDAKDEEVIKLRKYLKQYRAELEKNMNETENAAEKNQLGIEMNALNEHVIKPIDEYIKIKELSL